MVNKVSKRCVTCDKDFLIWKSEGNKYLNCSKQCSDTYRRRSTTYTKGDFLPSGEIINQPPKFKSGMKTTFDLKICEGCLKYFAVPKTFAHAYSTCGDVCSRLMKSKNKKALVDLVCSCGNIFMPRNAKSKFCSNDCRMNKLNHNRQPYRFFKCAQCGQSCSSRSPERKYCNTVCMRADGSLHKRRLRRQSPTKIESLLYWVLEKNNILFESQYCIGSYIVDAYLPDYNVVLEADGEYWHSKPERVVHDLKRKKYIISLGFEIFSFSDVELKDGPTAWKNVGDFLEQYKSHATMI